MKPLFIEITNLPKQTKLEMKIFCEIKSCYILKIDKLMMGIESGFDKKREIDS